MALCLVQKTKRKNIFAGLQRYITWKNFMLDKKSMHNIRKKRKIRSTLDGNIDQETDINSKLTSLYLLTSQED